MKKSAQKRLSGFILYRMKKIKKILITREGLEKLKEEIEELKRIRPEAVNTLSDARKMGDLSENGLYTAAKMRLKSIDAQIFRLNIQLKLADIIEPSLSGAVGLGSKIVVSKNGQKRKFYIVGDYEADPLMGKISSKSPLGKKILGKKINELIEVNTPSGKKTYKIEKIN